MQLPEYDPAYDPVEHIKAHGFKIIRHTLERCWAITNSARRQVLWDPRMPAHLEFGIFGHEASHVENLDPGGHHPRNEARADLHSALRRVNPVEWERLVGVHHDYDAICIELGITRGQFRALHEHERRKAASGVRLERLGSKVYLEPRMGAGQYAACYEAVA